jgi:hypothetical protein
MLSDFDKAHLTAMTHVELGAAYESILGEQVPPRAAIIEAASRERDARAILIARLEASGPGKVLVVDAVAYRLAKGKQLARFEDLRSDGLYDDHDAPRSDLVLSLSHSHGETPGDGDGDGDGDGVPES